MNYIETSSDHRIADSSGEGRAITLLSIPNEVALLRGRAPMGGFAANDGPGVRTECGEQIWGGGVGGIMVRNLTAAILTSPGDAANKCLQECQSCMY